MKIRIGIWMVSVTLAAISASCGGSIKKTQTVAPQQKPVALESSKEELLSKYNEFAKNVKSINSTVELKTTAGSKYSGVIDEYHEIKAFLLAERPSFIRMIGQAPLVGKTVFDMTSDDKEFRVWIPSKNKFLTGEVGLERTSSKPLENLRPQHLLDALLWPEVRAQEAVLFEESNDENARYYVLTVLRGGYQTEILRKIWFDRANLNVSRLETYGPKGVLLSDVHLSNWQGLIGDQAQTAPPSPSGTSESSLSSFPRSVRIERPHDDYTLNLEFTKIALNQDLTADKFKIDQPAGSELVTVGRDSDPRNPPEDKKQ